MAYTQLSRTTPVVETWQDITDEQNDAQTAAIYDVIGKHGGNVLTACFPDGGWRTGGTVR